MGPQSVLTIGTFDGVHVGHAALVRRCRELAVGAGARVVAMAFDPHPLTRLRPGAAPARLTGFPRKQAFLLRAGADEVVRLEPFDELLSLEPAAFVQQVVERYRPIAFVEGDDFRFGRGRAGSVETLREIGRGAGFGVEMLEPVEVMLGDGSIVRASSSTVRRLLLAGRASDAARVLGRPYEILGTVVQGDRRGRTIGYPTANVDTELLLPADGVYGAWATLPDGRRLGAALSIGTKPTFTNAPSRACEAFLMDVERPDASDPRVPGLPEYGWTLALEVVGWVREQVRFHSLEALLDHMARDCERIRMMLRDSQGASTVRGREEVTA